MGGQHALGRRLGGARRYRAGSRCRRARRPRRRRDVCAQAGQKGEWRIGDWKLSATKLTSPFASPLAVHFSSRDDIGRELILDMRDAVTQYQLALLEPLDQDDVGGRRCLERLDGGVEIVVLLPQAGKLCP